MQLKDLSTLGAVEQKRVDKVVEILSTVSTRGEEVAEIAHDARNMVTVLDLYCDLLQQPGVLAAPFAHYGEELHLVAAASRRLVSKLMSIETAEAGAGSENGIPGGPFARSSAAQEKSHQTWTNVPAEPIANLAAELLANRNLLAAMAGPHIALTLDAQGGAKAVGVSCEDLTRVLVNLVKNAAEAMSAVGRIHITLWESCGEPDNSAWLTLNVEDNGPGLSDKVLKSIFEPRQATANPGDRNGEWPFPHRGLGLAITRSIVEAAGGSIHAANRNPVGACFQIELPVKFL